MPGRYESWRDVPFAVLREFLAKLVREVGLREAGRLIGRGREGVRKIVSGDVQRPHQSTLEKLGKLYLESLEEAQGRKEPRGAEPGMARERPVEKLTPMPLKLILPRPLEKATAEIRAMFALIRRHPDAPETAAAVEQWLIRQVTREYGDENPSRRGKGRPDR